MLSGEAMKKNDKITVITCAAAFALNVALFSVKLYVGLCANSISIYSDAVNNMFDSLSGLAAFICFAALLSSSSEGTRAIIKKAEQFFFSADQLSFLCDKNLCVCPFQKRSRSLSVRSVSKPFLWVIHTGCC